MAEGRWSLSAKVICPVCGLKIGKKSYACPGPGFVPTHFYPCAYPEMAVTAGGDDGD